MAARSHDSLARGPRRPVEDEREIRAAGARRLALDLQHAAGNRATTSLLQRFSKASLKKDAPIPWLAETTEVKRLAGGASGGAYEAFSPKGTLVIKPLLELERTAGGGPEQQQFADIVLDRLMKLRAPERTRVVAAASPEGADIITILTTRIAGADDAASAREDMKTVRFFRVMEKLEGETLDRLAKHATSVEKVRNLAFRTFGDPEFMRQLGRLVVGDALIGNTDRLDALRAGNLGNIMLPYRGDGLIVFDTEVKLPDWPKSSTLLDLIDDVFDKRQAYFRNFEGAIRGFLPQSEDLQFALTVFLQQLGLRENAQRPFDEGIQSGIDRARKLSAGFFSDLKDLKKLAGRRYDSPQREAHLLSEESAQRTRWDRLKLNQLYLTLRAAGLDSAAARREIALFAAHRTARLREESAHERKSLSEAYEHGLKERLAAAGVKL
jgi:hypothetical protein